MRSSLVLSLALLSLSPGAVGCVKRTLTDGQIEGTIQAAASTDTVSDYEMARGAVFAGLAQFEGMHAVDADNIEGLLLLTRTWAAYGAAFIEDDLQIAKDLGDDDRADYDRNQARKAYDRAVYFGLQLLGQKASGFAEARKNEMSLSKWLADHFTDPKDVKALYWTGVAWAQRVDLMKADDDEGAGFVAELFIGVAMLERALALNPDYNFAAPLVALGAYHARSNIAELDQAKVYLDQAIARTQGKSLIAEFIYAKSYACMKGDAALYQDLLHKVLWAQDTDPEQRLTNQIAKRWAKRWLHKKRAKDSCGIELSSDNGAAAPPPPPPPAAVAPPATPAPAEAAKPAAAGPLTPPTAPAAIAVPAGVQVVLKAQARGSQVYTCKPKQGAKDKEKEKEYEWSATAPDAGLFDDNGQKIGKHFGGNFAFEAADGSRVTGKPRAKADAPEAGAIPWLLFETKSTGGQGTLSKVKYIQRVATVGGQPPATGCDAAHKNAEARVDYSATYYMYAP
jgi:hypothetical protein